MIEDLLISEADFDSVRQISRHCTWDNLTPFIRERQNIDLINLLGNSFYADVLVKACEGEYDDLLDGCNYEFCGETRISFGLRRCLLHFSYAAFVIEGGLVSTPHGMVQKTSMDSIPVEFSQLKNMHNSNRKIAMDYWLTVKDYLAANCNDYPLFKHGKSETDSQRGGKITFITKSND